MRRVYLIYHFENGIGRCIYTTDDKTYATHLINEYVRNVLGYSNWTDKPYEDFLFKMDIDDINSVWIQDSLLIRKEKKDE